MTLPYRGVLTFEADAPSPPMFHVKHPTQTDHARATTRTGAISVSLPPEVWERAPLPSDVSRETFARSSSMER